MDQDPLIACTTACENLSDVDTAKIAGELLTTCDCGDDTFDAFVSVMSEDFKTGLQAYLNGDR